MSIHKIYRRDNQPFAQIPNEAIRDPRITVTAFRLLAYLMSHQDGYEIGYEQIERQTGMGRYAINEAIKNLEKLGWLLVERPKLPNGQFTNKTWTVLNPLDAATVGNSTMESHHMGQSTDIKKTTTKEEQVKELSESKAQERFDLFWSIYPRKDDKKPAKKAFDRLSEADQLAAIEGAKRYAADPNLGTRRWQKMGATWLNGECWNNGPLPEMTKFGPKVDKIAERERENAERLARLLAEEAAKNEQA